MLLMLSWSVFSFCFHGTTSSCAFECHCEGTCVQYRSGISGRCQNGCTRIGASNQFPWSGKGCQWGNLAIASTSSSHLGDNSRVPGRAIDGDTSRVMSTLTFSLSMRDFSGLSWRVHLGSNYFVIRYVTLYTVNTYESTVVGVDIFVSDDNVYTSTEENRCGTQSGTTNPTTTITCPQLMKGKYVYVVQNNITITELALAEVEIHGYEYYDCIEHFNGDYWYGPGCLKRCNCHTQCDDVTGACPGECDDGYIQVSNQ